MRNWLILISVWSICTQVWAQDKNYLPQEYIIQLKHNTDVNKVQTLLSQWNGQPTNLRFQKQLIPDMNIWQVVYDNKVIDQLQLLEYISAQKFVEIAQNNHEVILRSNDEETPLATTPNDPFFNDQWQYINPGGSNGGIADKDIDAELAWDLTTGGLTAQGDTIVVAVIDNGIKANHEDFGDNLWVNYAEIPNNGIDDDNNGYIDDYNGWNSNTNNDNIGGGSHGTPVAGIIGAKGNNNIGITGVNWDIKMMIIRNDFNANEANVLAAYGYALTQRKRYNATCGAEGAYVVVTNASWGIDKGKAADHPLWCAFYDTLGQHGILNVGATANTDDNVELVGDMPTTCTSDYLIGVTNINITGNKVQSAAYGNTSIDLGAPGDGSYTLSNNTGNYGSFSGTSAAAPHVAGAIGLLYAAACSDFISWSRLYPDSAAQKMKEFILTGVDQNSSLTNITVSDGNLNLFKSAVLCQQACPTTSCYAPYCFSIANVTSASVDLSWANNLGTNTVEIRYRIVGGTWSSPIAIGQSNYTLNGLQACADYEIELKAICSGSNSTTVLHQFRTDGCCDPPTKINLSNIGSSSATLSWVPQAGVTAYSVRYRAKDSTNWITTTTANSAGFTLIGLTNCTEYYVAIKSSCSNGSPEYYSDSLSFYTKGCSTCTVVNYCSAKGNSSLQDFIKRIDVGGFDHTSGNNNGYYLYDSVKITLRQGDFHMLFLEQGATPNPFKENIRVWLDINQDGDFDDPQEQIFSHFFSTKTMNRPFIVPSSTLLGITRMRLSLRWGQGNTPPDCGNFIYGEVEDYCVEVVVGTPVEKIDKPKTYFQAYPNPFQTYIDIDLQLFQESTVHVELLDMTGKTIYTNSLGTYSVGQHQLKINPARELPQGIYLLRLTTNDTQLIQKLSKF